jgi:hypothetical protein
MKSGIPFFLLLCIISLPTKAQYYFYNNDYYDNAITYEAGISIGPMNSLTDIGGRKGRGTRGPKDLNLKSTKLYGSIYASAIFKHFLAVRLEATAGSIKSNDSLLAPVKSSNGSIGRYNRNLSFRSPIDEISLTLEFHPIDFFSNFNPEKYPPALSPYLIGGIGFFHFNPQANLNGEWIDLRPLHTEGEGFAEYPDRKEYKLNQVNIPLGVGVAYELSPKFNIRLEYISRTLFTDYLDDVHSRYIDPSLFSKYLSGKQLTDALILNNRGRADAVPNLTTAHPGGIRGNPLNTDSYFTVNVKVGFVFGRDQVNGNGNGGGGNSRISRRAQKRQLACPRLY